MAKVSVRRDPVTRFIAAAHALVRLPQARFSVDYDQDADVLYISYVKPQRATDSELLPSGVILNRRGKYIVGVTILDASKR